MADGARQVGAILNFGEKNIACVVAFLTLSSKQQHWVNLIIYTINIMVQFNFCIKIASGKYFFSLKKLFLIYEIQIECELFSV